MSNPEYQKWLDVAFDPETEEDEWLLPGITEEEFNDLTASYDDPRIDLLVNAYRRLRAEYSQVSNIHGVMQNGSQ
jgi:hypothetical protein